MVDGTDLKVMLSYPPSADVRGLLESRTSDGRRVCIGSSLWLSDNSLYDEFRTSRRADRKEQVFPGTKDKDRLLRLVFGEQEGARGLCVLTVVEVRYVFRISVPLKREGKLGLGSSFFLFATTTIAVS